MFLISRKTLFCVHIAGPVCRVTNMSLCIHCNFISLVIFFPCFFPLFLAFSVSSAHLLCIISRYVLCIHISIS